MRLTPTSAVLLSMATGALAGTSVTESFETLGLGQLDGQGGWHGWDGNNTAHASVVDTNNHTGGGVQSAELRAGADSLREFDYTTGRWVITAWTFVPTSFVGKTYFIVLNSYQNGGPYEWSGQVGFNGDVGMLQCDCGTSGTVARPLVRGAWVDLVFDVDLDLDTVSVFYNTASDPDPLATYAWTGGIFGADNHATTAIEAIDLYPDAFTYPHVSPCYFDDISIEPAQGPPTTIGITAVQGARKNAVGNFDQLTDTTAPGRLFVDTIAGGMLLAHPDQQYVKLEVEVGPANLDPALYEVRWEARDPDDPADHVDVDTNDWGPLIYQPLGGDNIDAKPMEGATARNFFQQADHAISNVSNDGSNPLLETQIIGRATTQIDANRKSTVFFHYGDEGGDNYVIKAICVKKAGNTDEAFKESGLLTVWRVRNINVSSMTKPNDDQVVPVALNPTEKSVCVNPGANSFSDSYLADDDKYSNNDATHVLVGADKAADTQANAGGLAYFPATDLTALIATIRESYASSAGNHALYIDPVLDTVGLNTTYQGVLTEANGTNTGTGEHVYSQNHTGFHGGPGNNVHPKNTYHLLGIRTFGALSGSRGSAAVRPHAYINILRILQLNEAGGTTAGNVKKTVVHELGHLHIPEAVDDIHTGHSSAPHHACCGIQGTSVETRWCPKHARKLRENVTRAWDNHDSTIPRPLDTARDSD